MTLPNGVLVEYFYDLVSRITEIRYSQGITVLGNLTYEYDRNGNRTKIGGTFARTGLPQSIASTAYNAANHQTTFGDKTLTYDNNGNLQTITDGSGTRTYTWNARNQLVGISGPGMSASFVYDGLGRRESKTINGNLTEFLFDGRNPVQETSGATVLANILPGLGIDEFLTRTDVPAAVTSHFLPDALGSTIALSDSAGTVQTEYTYEPFGKTSSSGASNSSSYQYTGRENDGSALYYYRARYYHPQLQRFLSDDPIGFGGGDINLYAYVGNSPINFTDPTGEWAWLIRLCSVVCTAEGRRRIAALILNFITNTRPPDPTRFPPKTPPKIEGPLKGPPVVVPPIPPADEPPGDNPPGDSPPGCGRKDCPPPPGPEY